MRSKYIKYVVLSLSFACLLKSKMYAQDEHFIYIQADAKQAFNAVVNDKNYTSSDIGYLIIPGLQNGNCNISVRLSEDSITQLNFILAINGKDEGFQLKNFGAKGWGLFNLQTMDVVFSGVQTSVGDQAKTAAKSKAFGDMLSDVVNDSTLNKPVAQPAANNTSIVANPASSPAVTNDIPSVSNTTTQSIITSNAGLQNAASAGVKGIIKTSQHSDEMGTSAIFVDVADNKNDTVNIFIPAVETSMSNNNSAGTSQNSVNAAVTPSINTNTAADNSNTVTNKNENETKNPFYSPGNTGASTNSSNILAASSPLQSANTACTKMADESDLYKLRKKMISETDATSMIVVAKKQLKDKCVSTEQVKEIGALFLSDEARYDFYEAMYKFTYDPANYISLQSQLIDDYYKKRFMALLH